MITYNPNLKIFYSTLVNDNKYITGFGTSLLGDARNIETIFNYFKSSGLNFDKIVLLEQIHSVNVEEFTKPSSPAFQEMISDADGVITEKSGVSLIVRNADCVPLIIADKKSGRIGISHQGWRGSLKNMAKKMVTDFLRLNSQAGDLDCAIGPAIGACCYDVDEDHYYEFLEEYDRYAGRIFHYRKGRWHINLAYLNYLQLVESGVDKNRVDFFPFCTSCDEKRFFSRRRMGSSFPKLFNFVMKV